MCIEIQIKPSLSAFRKLVSVRDQMFLRHLFSHVLFCSVRAAAPASERRRQAARDSDAVSPGVGGATAGDAAALAQRDAGARPVRQAQQRHHAGRWRRRRQEDAETENGEKCEAPNMHDSARSNQVLSVLVSAFFLGFLLKT